MPSSATTGSQRGTIGNTTTPSRSHDRLTTTTSSSSSTTTTTTTQGQQARTTRIQRLLRGIATALRVTLRPRQRHGPVGNARQRRGRTNAKPSYVPTDAVPGTKPSYVHGAAHALLPFCEITSARARRRRNTEKEEEEEEEELEEKKKKKKKKTSSRCSLPLPPRSRCCSPKPPPGS